MKNVVVPTLIAAVVAAAVSWFALRSGYGGPDATSTVTPGDASGPSASNLAKLLTGYKKNPATTTLLLTKQSGACKAEVGDDPVGNVPEKRVFWLILNDSDYPCMFKDPYPKVTLTFTSTGQYPFTTKDVKSKHTSALDFVFEKIKKHGSNGTNEVEYGLYTYKVYLTNGVDVDPAVPILDPDLEVEDGNRNNTPPAPAKKQ